MKPLYCYWSVCDGEYGSMMEHCVRSARRAGVFTPFHVLCDRVLDGCECYDAFRIEKADGLFKLHYLKAGMSRLNYEYFVWLDADSLFLRKPVDILSALCRAPLHVPLEENLSALAVDRAGPGMSLFRLRDLMRQEGVANCVYSSGSAFWVIHHDAIETVYDVSLRFWHQANKAGVRTDVGTALGYAMQMLCAAPEKHLLETHPDLWAGDGVGRFTDVLPDGKPWEWRPSPQAGAIPVQPALAHLPHSKGLLLGASRQRKYC